MLPTFPRLPRQGPDTAATKSQGEISTLPRIGEVALPLHASRLCRLGKGEAANHHHKPEKCSNTAGNKDGRKQTRAEAVHRRCVRRTSRMPKQPQIRS